jgi:hypothetical protein
MTLKRSTLPTAEPLEMPLKCASSSKSGIKKKTSPYTHIPKLQNKKK